MHVYSDSKVSDFLSSVTDDQRIGFLNEWNENRDHREKIYISYDSTNKYCQAEDLELVEVGHAKDERKLYASEEMARQLDGVYRLDHAITATQKTILKAFGLTDTNMKYRAQEISRLLEISV